MFITSTKTWGSLVVTLGYIIFEAGFKIQGHFTRSNVFHSPTKWCPPPVISWFTIPSNYRYNSHKPYIVIVVVNQINYLKGPTFYVLDVKTWTCTQWSNGASI